MSQVGLAKQVADFIALVHADADVCSHTIHSGAGLFCVTVA